MLAQHTKKTGGEWVKSCIAPCLSLFSFKLETWKSTLQVSMKPSEIKYIKLGTDEELS